MSEIGKPVEEPKPEPTLIQQEGEVPETVVPVEPVAEPEPEPEKPDEPKPEEPKSAAPAKRPWFQTRIDELTRLRRDEQRAREAAEAELKVIKAQKPAEEGADPLKVGLSRADWDAQVRTEAQKLVQQQMWENKAQNWLEAGNKEFGSAAFNEKCDMVAALGAADRPEFRSLIVDPDIVPDGHKVVMRLADNPEEAQRILAIVDPVKLAAALTKFAMTEPKPDVPVSKAPKPITPIGGTAKNAGLSDNDDIKSWMAKRREQIAARQKSV